MNLCKKGLLVILCLSMFLGACFNPKHPRNKMHFYILDYDPPRIIDLKPLSHVIRIGRFCVAPLYNTTHIIYQDDSFKRDAYVYHKWRVNPGDLVTCLLRRDIKESSLFKAVLPNESRFISSYMMEGVVEDFFERDLKEAWEAVLGISITLMAEREPDISKKIIFQKTYRAQEVCKQKNPQALAVAMSQAMAKVSEKIIRDTYRYLKDRK